MPLPRPLASVPSTAGAAVPPRAPPPRPSRRDVLGAALLTALLPLPRPARADDGAPPAGAGLLARMPAQEAPIGEPAPAPVDAGRAEEAGSGPLAPAPGHTSASSCVPSGVPSLT